MQEARGPQCGWVPVVRVWLWRWKWIWGRGSQTKWPEEGGREICSPKVVSPVPSLSQHCRHVKREVAFLIFVFMSLSSLGVRRRRARRPSIRTSCPGWRAKTPSSTSSCRITTKHSSTLMTQTAQRTKRSRSTTHCQHSWRWATCCCCHWCVCVCMWFFPWKQRSKIHEYVNNIVKFVSLITK